MPRVEYQLSFENYLEMTTNRHGKPSYRSALVLAAIGAALLTTGFVYLRYDPPENWTFIGGVLLASGLLFTFLAFVQGFFFAPRRAKPDSAMLRREYELYASDRRVLEFDEDGWQVTWYEGDDVRPWPSLRSLHDLNGLLVLSTVGTHYWFPKTALKADSQLENLKSIATRWIEREPARFTVPTKPNLFVWILANVVNNWANNLRRNILGYSCGSILVYWLVFTDWNGPSKEPGWMMLLLPAILFCIELLHYCRRYYGAKWSEAAHEARITDTGIGYRTNKITWFCPYRDFESWKEIPGTFMLYIHEREFHFVPKAAMSPDLVGSFREMIKAKAPK